MLLAQWPLGKARLAGWIEPNKGRGRQSAPLAIDQHASARTVTARSGRPRFSPSKQRQGRQEGKAQGDTGTAQRR